MKKKQAKKQHSAALLLTVFFGVTAIVAGVLIIHQAKRAQRVNGTVPNTTVSATAQGTTEQQAQGTDAQTYYADNAQKILSVTPAQESERILSEKQIGEELGTRGFGENAPITYGYSLEGSVEQKTEIDASSEEAHPQYTTLYVTAKGDYWTISVCDGCVTAYPVTYNLEHNSGTEVIFTENDSITAYDSATNSFYDMVPKASVLVMKHIPAITAEALEQLTAEEIEKR